MANYKFVDADQLDSDLSSIANTIRKKGGTSASMSFPDGFNSAVNAISTGVTVQRKSGTLTTNSSGVTTVNCGFQPDLVYIYLDTVSENSESFSSAFCAAFIEGNTSKVLAHGMIGIYGVAQGKFERTTTGFRATLYNPSLTWEFAPLTNYSLDYIAVKYT